MAEILAPPETQFCDENGVPYAGGTVTTYIPGTSTLKDTWQDEAETILNTNPITLDAAGRCIMLGDGDYRIVLQDVAGNLIYDQWTTSIVSDAMQPVVSGSIANAQNLLGITGSGSALQAEINRATAAENILTTNLNAEISRAEAAESELDTDLSEETTRAENAEANLQSQITALGGGGALPAGYSFRFGEVTSSSSGAFSGTFSPPFPTACACVVTSAGIASWWGNVTSISAGGFSGTTTSPLSGGSWAGGPVPVAYIAIGN